MKIIQLKKFFDLRYIFSKIILTLQIKILNVKC